jgi:hypothetical protein
MIDEIHQLWHDHLAAPFPEDLAGEEIDGEDMVSLDSFTAGCVSSVLGSSRPLTPDRVACLIRCRDGLEKVLPRLEGTAKAYYTRLLRMSQLVLRAFDQ